MTQASTWDRAALAGWLTERVAGLAGIRLLDVDQDRPLDEFGLSSRAAVALSGELEDLLDRPLPATLVWECPTIARLAERLAAPALTSEDKAAEVPSEVTGPGPVAGRGGPEPIAVVGIGCRFPGSGTGPRRFWEFLLAERDAVGQVPAGRWEAFDDGSATTAAVLDRTTRHGAFLPDITGFDAEFFGITPREAALMDPQQRMVLEVAWEALEHAAIAPDSLRGGQHGVFVGASCAEYARLTVADLGRVDAWTGTGAALSIIANRLSYALDLRGPSMVVDTACSSSLVAAHLAAQSLRLGECDLALAGGVNLLLSPAVTVTFDQAGTMAADGRCKTFDAGADGYVRGEGAGLVVLKRLADARRDGDQVLAVLRGGAVNSDGRSNGLMAPNPDAQEALLRTAYQRAGLTPDQVDYVEAHGTGTLLGDPIEAGALGRVLGAGRQAADPLLIGSAKTNLGHLEAAAGIAGLIKVVLALHRGRIPASRNFTTPNPHIPFEDLRLRVAATSTPWPVRDRPARAGVSSFGFGGVNAHLVLEQAGPAAEDPDADAGQPGHASDVEADVPSPVVVPVGGGSPERVRDYAAALLSHLRGPGAQARLVDVGHTLTRRSAAARTRAFVVTRDRAGLLDGLSALAAGQPGPGLAGPAVRAPHTTGVGAAGGAGAAGQTGAAGPVLVFSGQGSQWAGMGRGLLAASPAFRDAVARLDPLFRAELGFPLGDTLERGADLVAVDQVQPVLFGMQVALAETWRAHGVAPAAVIGHSMGEAAAAVVCGALAPADGLRVVAVRSRLAGTLAGAGGAMAVLGLPAADAARLAERHPGVDLAVYAAPDQTVLAGPRATLRRLVAELDSAGVPAALVKVDFASHSRQVAPLLEPLRQRLDGLRPGEPEVPWLSTVTPGQPVVADAAYWAANLREPVRFAPVVAGAAAAGHTWFVEVSPHPLLTAAMTDTLRDAGVAEPLVLPTLRRDADEQVSFLTQLATLAAHGLPLPAGSLPAPTGRQLDLPTTPWRHSRHWFPAAGVVPAQARPKARRPVASAPPVARTTAEPAGPAADPAAPDALAWAGPAALRAMPAEAALATVTSRLVAQVADVMGYPTHQLSTASPLTELGLDSLMAARVRNAVRHDFDLDLPAAVLLRGASIAEAARWIAGALGVQGPADAAGEPPPAAEPAVDADEPGPVTPRDTAERLVAGVWAEVLGVEPASVHLDLAQLGGASQARRIAAILRERAGEPVDAAALLAARTVADMAHLVRQALASAGDAPLRVLRAPSDGDRPPLFLFHPAGGDTSVYRQLVRLLPADQPVYGLDRQEGSREIVAKATGAVELIRAQQPHGPYQLGGWSYGGFVAYETARQLSEAGERVATLALIDSLVALPPQVADYRALVTLRFQQFAQYLQETYGRPIDLPYELLPELDEEGQIDAVLAVLAASGAVDGVAGQAILAHQRTSYLDLRAVERYAPATRYQGPVTLFRAAIAHGGIRDSRYQRHDATLGWDEIAGDGLRVVTVPGHHLSVLDPPNVSTLAGHLTGLLVAPERALRE